MNILLISYGDFDYDGRLRELYKVFGQLGTLHAITRGATAQDPRHKVINCGYAAFIKQAVAYGKSLGRVDVLVLDNRKSVIPGMLLRKSLKPRIIIQDCRELYVPGEVSHLAGKLGCVVEKYGIKRSHILICANRERAEFMTQMFRLPETPIVYENLRALAYSSPAAQEKAAAKLAPYIHEDELRIVSTSGCSVSRTNDILVQNLDKVERRCRLFLVGANTSEDEAAIAKIVAQKGLSNVEIVGQLNQDELKYLISVSHIGIVNYHQKDLNNKFCASGKIYEFIYEGIPVVTTTNPPLKRLCEEARIGYADDQYAAGINIVAANMEQYRHHVADFAAANAVADNNERLRQELSEQISKRGVL